MQKGEKTDFRFFIAKHGFFSMLPTIEPSGMPYDVENTSAFTAEMFLYRKIIDQAVHDLGSKDPEIRNEAEEWFDLRDKDFCEICDLAGFTPQAVYNAVRYHLDSLAKDKSPMNKVLEKYKVKNTNELAKVILNA